jgi:hypothetical protein
MNVFVVFECVPYEGEWVRGIYLTSEDAEVRKKYLDDTCHFKVDYEVRELGIGIDLEVE